MMALAASMIGACSLAPAYWMPGVRDQGQSSVPVVPDTGPGAPGFVPGTLASPRIVRMLAGPGDTFTPANLEVARGETVTFEVTAMGPLVHEFKVGPLDAVRADAEGLPELTDLSMMQTKLLTYTFTGVGPYGFACHEPGHYEAGMWGTITVASS